MENLKSSGELGEFFYCLLQKQAFVLQGLLNSFYHLLSHSRPHIQTEWEGLVSGLGLFAFVL